MLGRVLEMGTDLQFYVLSSWECPVIYLVKSSTDMAPTLLRSRFVEIH